MKDIFYLFIIIVSIMAIPVVFTVASTLAGTIFGVIFGVLIPGVLFMAALRSHRSAHDYE